MNKKKPSQKRVIVQCSDQVKAAFQDSCWRWTEQEVGHTLISAWMKMSLKDRIDFMLNHESQPIQPSPKKQPIQPGSFLAEDIREVLEQKKHFDSHPQSESESIDDPSSKLRRQKRSQDK